MKKEENQYKTGSRKILPFYKVTPKNGPRSEYLSSSPCEAEK